MVAEIVQFFGWTRTECYFVHLWIGVVLGFMFKRNGLWIAILFGLGKETYDYYVYGGFDTLDMVCTITGGLIKDLVCYRTGLTEYLTTIKIKSRWNLLSRL